MSGERVPAVITGANGGLGRALAKKAEDYFSKVIKVDKSTSDQASLYEVQADVTVTQQLQTELAYKLSALNMLIGCLVIAAGIGQKRPGKLPPYDAEEIWKINYQGAVNTVEVLQGLMIPHATIVLLTSDMNKLDRDIYQDYAQSTSLLRRYGKELADKQKELRVLTLILSPVNTPLYHAQERPQAQLSNINERPVLMEPEGVAKIFYSEVYPETKRFPSGSRTQISKNSAPVRVE